MAMLGRIPWITVFLYKPGGVPISMFTPWPWGKHNSVLIVEPSPGGPAPKPSVESLSTVNKPSSDGLQPDSLIQ